MFNYILKDSDFEIKSKNNKQIQQSNIQNGNFNIEFKSVHFS